MLQPVDAAINVGQVTTTSLTFSVCGCTDDEGGGGGAASDL